MAARFHEGRVLCTGFNHGRHLFWKKRPFLRVGDTSSGLKISELACVHLWVLIFCPFQARSSTRSACTTRAWSRSTACPWPPSWTSSSSASTVASPPRSTPWTTSGNWTASRSRPPLDPCATFSGRIRSRTLGTKRMPSTSPTILSGDAHTFTGNNRKRKEQLSLTSIFLFDWNYPCLRF